MLAKRVNEFNSPIEELSSQIGNTPLLDFSELSSNARVSIFAKAEWLQFGGSVKIRPAFKIISQAIIDGELLPGKTLLDASSGNTAIAYAAICAKIGISVMIVLPENVSKERKSILKSYGVEIVYSSPFGGTDEAQKEAKKIYDSDPEKYYYADQYNNPNNWLAHYDTTAVEIWKQSEGQLTHFIAGLGTSGSFVGISKRLKEYNSNVQCVALQPATAMHVMEGWKHMETAVVPGIYDPFVADDQMSVLSEVAMEVLTQTARTTGYLLSPSSAANLCGAMQLTEKIETGMVVTMLPDNGEKYLDLISEVV